VEYHQALSFPPTVKEDDCSPLFRKAWVDIFIVPTVLRSFEATGIVPLNPNQILNRFIDNASEASASSAPSTSMYSGDEWLNMQSLIGTIAKDKSSKEARKLHRSLHHLTASNQLLQHRVEGLTEVLKVEEKHRRRPRFCLSKSDRSITMVLFSGHKVKERKQRSIITYFSA
jgi:hypothetical protein